MLESLKMLVKRFWWVLALLGILVAFWLRSRLRQAKMADGLEAQRDLERKAAEEYRESGNRGRAARAQLNRELEASRKAWDARKTALEQEMANDEGGLATAWKRAFGRNPSDKRAESTGD